MDREEKAPVTVGAVTGAESNTAEAVLNAQAQYRLTGCGTQEVIHSDVP